MYKFATDSCNNLFQFVDTVYLHGFSGGTRRDTGCLFLSFRQMPDKPAKREVQVGGLSLTQPVKRVMDISIIIYPLNP